MKKYLIYLLMAVGFAGCVSDNEEMDSYVPSVDGMARVRVNLINNDFKVAQVRSGDVLGEEDENTWDNVWVAQFDDAGNIIDATIQGHANTGFVMNLQPGSTSTVYFVANMPNSPFSPGMTVTQFLDQMYDPGSYEGIMDNNRMVMMGKWEGPVSASTDVMSIQVFLRKMVSKVRVIVKANQSAMSSTIGYYFASLKVKGFQLCNVMKATKFGPGNVATSVTQLTDMPQIVPVENSESSTKNLIVYDTKDYYVFENMHGDLAPEGTLDKDKNRYAPLDASDNDLATYVKIWADLEDGRNHGEVVYKVYLGKDGSRNFDIQRHTFYTVTITIDGTGEATQDIRADDSGVNQLQLQRLDGSPATTRLRETRYVRFNQTEWGKTYAASSQDAIKVFSGTEGVTWGFESYNSTSSGAVHSTDPTPWGNLVISTDNGATWTPAAATGNPSGARIAVTMPQSSLAAERFLMLRFKNDNDPTLTREWIVAQSPDASISIPQYVYIKDAAGVYPVPIRATSSIEWKVWAPSNSNSTFESVLEGDGTVVSDTSAYTTSGHGTILLRARANNGTGYRSNRITVWYRAAGSTEAPQSQNVTVYQYPSRTRLETSANRYFYKYSSAPLYESFSANNNRTILWGYDLVEQGMDYINNEYLIPAHSNTDGKANTLAAYQVQDKYVWDNSNLPPNVTRSAFSPAAICMMMNDNYENITSTSDPNFKWYLPARYESLMDVTSVMLGLPNVADGVNASAWSSTVSSRASSFNEVKYSAYFAGINADVLGMFSQRTNTKCVRKIDYGPSDLTYPYMKIVDEYPVITVYEETAGGPQGYTENYTSTTNKLGRPLRQVEDGDVNGAVTGRGPVMPNESTLSHKFQVAKQDATSATVNWRVANGWNASATGTASPKTGCLAYTEGDFTDWRIPTPMELRIMGLLKAGGNASPVPKLYNNGDDFSSVPGFVAMNGSYWTNQQYVDGSSTLRAYYVEISNSAGINGSAKNKTEAGRVRCVRDIF